MEFLSVENTFFKIEFTGWYNHLKLVGINYRVLQKYPKTNIILTSLVVREYKVMGLIGKFHLNQVVEVGSRGWQYVT